MNEQKISAIRKFAISNSENDDIHGFPHVERVYNLCLELGTKLNANINVLKISALLHDVGRKSNDNDVLNHAELSATIVKKYFDETKLNLSIKEKQNVFHSIIAHSFSNKVRASTLEAKILSDVDKIDALGAIGLYRTIGFTIKNGGNLDDVLNHLQEKILRLYDKLYLDISKQIALERTKFIEMFYDRVLKEIVGKDQI